MDVVDPAWMDARPDIGAGLEPSLRDIVRFYYEGHFSPEDACRLRDDYCAALRDREAEKGGA